MTSHIYILTDGINTKIGITTDLAKRMASYQTHNPNFQIYKTYSCSAEEAKRIETTIKAAFKDRLTGKSKEWFSVGSGLIDRYVSVLIQPIVEENLSPSLHGVRLTNEAYELKEQILDNRLSSENRYARKEKLSELFGRLFGLGLPEHKLPEGILFKEKLTVDFSSVDKESDTVNKFVWDNNIRFPCDDHYYNFYHLVRLGSGHFIAVCTAQISMPYLEAMEGKKDSIIDLANELGWYATFHDDWSWHFPGRTGLILYQQKAPVLNRLRSWDNSFRKWVIERAELLKHEKFSDRKRLAKTIEDIVGDCTFPLDAASFNDFFDRYISKYFCDSKEDFPFTDTYEFLFERWKGKRQ
jgi:hypothetical protein